MDSPSAGAGHIEATRTYKVSGWQTQAPSTPAGPQGVGHAWDRREGTSHGLDTAVPTDAPRGPGDFLPPRPGSAKVNGGPGAVRPGLCGPQTHHSLHPNTRLQERANWSGGFLAWTECLSFLYSRDPIAQRHSAS